MTEGCLCSDSELFGVSESEEAEMDVSEDSKNGMALGI